MAYKHDVFGRGCKKKRATTGRWERLERYARWRKGSFPLHALPHDVLEHVAQFLPGEDVQSLIEVVLGWRPSVDVPTHVKRVPIQVRARWMYQEVVDRADAFLSSIADLCFFHAKEHTHVCVFFDWSPFAPTPPCPIAQFRWVPWKTPRARMTVHAAVLRSHLIACCKARRAESHVAVHTCLTWNNRIVLHPKPILLTSCPLIPHFLFP